MAKCAAGYDIPWEGPCAKCGATENDTCREIDRLDAEARAAKQAKTYSPKICEAMDREDKRRSSPIRQTF